MTGCFLKMCCLAAIIFAIVMMGCGGNDTAEKEKKNTGIFNKKTQNIGEFDKDGERKLADNSITPTNPLNPLGAMKNYSALSQKVVGLGIEKALQLFQAEHGRFPRTHKEFMDKIIRRNNIQLPVLPAGAEWQYDVENHKMVAVEAAEEK